METIAAITILVPMLLLIALKIGIDPVHLGIMLILNLMIGLLPPPVGMVLYVLSQVSGVSFERCVMATLPFLVPLVLVLMAITFIPQLSMWLPTLIYRKLMRIQSRCIIELTKDTSFHVIDRWLKTSQNG